MVASHSGGGGGGVKACQCNHATITKGGSLACSLLMAICGLVEGPDHCACTVFQTETGKVAFAGFRHLMIAVREGLWCCNCSQMDQDMFAAFSLAEGRVAGLKAWEYGPKYQSASESSKWGTNPNAAIGPHFGVLRARLGRLQRVSNPLEIHPVYNLMGCFVQHVAFLWCFAGTTCSVPKSRPQMWQFCVFGPSKNAGRRVVSGHLCTGEQVCVFHAV